MLLFLVLALSVMASPSFAQTSNPSLKATAVAIPGGSGGVGFDDIGFSSQLHKLLVPAGHTGKLYLIDPVTFEMITIEGFSSSPQFQKGHHTGVSSAAAGDGFIFTADHGTKTLDAADVKTGKFLARAALSSDADIVRYVPNQEEVWATEPDEKKQIEVFKFQYPTTHPYNLNAHPVSSLVHVLNITVSDGPESLTIDQTHQKAYTNLGPNVGVIDLKSHAVIAQWPNGCQKPRGTAVDEANNLLFVACGEGKTVVFDLNQNGKEISSLTTGPGADLVDYNPRLSHFYITGSKNATLSVLGVSSKGELSLLGVGEAAERSHCVAGDDQNNIWVCDPKHGQLLRYKDTFARSN